MYQYKYPIVLASASPRRKQLLEWADIPFTVDVANTDEQIPTNTRITDIPIIIASEKAIAVQQKHPHQTIIIAADTIVEVKGKILGKPADSAEALQMLKSLNGQTHTVITGVCILSPDETIRFSTSTEVIFNELCVDELSYYIDRYKPYDKAGSYAIQEWIGAVGIQKINGDFFNVMGLPIHEVYAALKKFIL